MKSLVLSLGVAAAVLGFSGTASAQPGFVPYGGYYGGYGFPGYSVYRPYGGFGYGGFPGYGVYRPYGGYGYGFPGNGFYRPYGGYGYGFPGYGFGYRPGVAFNFSVIR